MAVKKFFALALICIAVIGLSSGFRQKLHLIERLKGQWKIEKITYTLSTGDSVIQGPAAEFNFAGGADPSGQYEGYYQFNGKSKYAFLYQLESSQPTSGELIIGVLSPPGQPLNRQTFFGTQPDFSSIWTISELKDGTIKLSGQAVLVRRANGKEEMVGTEIKLKQ